MVQSLHSQPFACNLELPRFNNNNTKKKKKMETAPKLERKYIEKNRRIHLKGLYNHLFSLLPTHLSLGGMSLPDQVGETVKYITFLQNQMEQSKQRKQELLQKKNTRKRPHSSSSSANSPHIQVLDFGPATTVVLINGLECAAEFHDIIRLLHQQGLEVSNANFQLHGNSMLQILHHQECGVVWENLKQVINGNGFPCGSEVVESEPLNFWDFNVENIWGFPILEPFQQQLHNPPPPYCTL